jgi:translation initiation factor 2B subunit (eIF-2B alpha/beta/delta family)
MMSLYVQNVDAVIIGADTVLSNGNVVNKAGSKALALLCKEYKRPFYVVTAQSKYSRKKTYRSKSENPDEVWDKKVKNLSINNIYFEEIEKKFITKIFTE